MTGAQPDRNNRMQVMGAIAAAAPVLWFSFMMFRVWADPMGVGDGRWIPFGVGVMVMEFILLHSGVFMAAALGGQFGVKNRALGFAGLMLFYGLMAWGISISTGSLVLLWMFAAVVLGRSVTAVFNREAGMGYLIARSVIGVVFYIFIVFASVMFPIPEWGITPDIVAEVYPDRGSGVWEQEPQRAIAGAAVYFLAMGLVELFVLGPALQRFESGAS